MKLSEIVYADFQRGMLLVRPTRYVCPLPDVNKGKWWISTNDGSSPLWSRDDRKLFYLSGDAAIIASAEIEPAFKPLKSTVLIRGTFRGGCGIARMISLIGTSAWTASDSLR